MNRASRLMLALLFAGFLVGPAPAQSPDQNPLVVDHPWARATPRGAKTGVVYLSLVNNGSGDRLLEATTPVAQKVQFHSASEEAGVSRMHEMQSIEIAPGAKIIFTPGGLHIMLVGLKQPLQQGQTFPMTLTFEKAGTREVTVPIANVGAMQAEDTPAMTHSHGDRAK